MGKKNKSQSKAADLSEFKLDDNHSKPSHSSVDSSSVDSPSNSNSNSTMPASSPSDSAVADSSSSASSSSSSSSSLVASSSSSSSTESSSSLSISPSSSTIERRVTCSSCMRHVPVSQFSSKQLNNAARLRKCKECIIIAEQQAKHDAELAAFQELAITEQNKKGKKKGTNGAATAATSDDSSSSSSSSSALTTGSGSASSGSSPPRGPVLLLCSTHGESVWQDHPLACLAAHHFPTAVHLDLTNETSIQFVGSLISATMTAQNAYTRHMQSAPAPSIPEKSGKTKHQQLVSQLQQYQIQPLTVPLLQEMHRSLSAIVILQPNQTPEQGKESLKTAGQLRQQSIVLPGPRRNLSEEEKKKVTECKTRDERVQVCNQLGIFMPPDPEVFIEYANRLFEHIATFQRKGQAIQAAALLLVVLGRIHLFDHGNGRLCRVLANCILQDAGLGLVCWDDLLDYELAYMRGTAQDVSQMIAYINSHMQRRAIQVPPVADHCNRYLFSLIQHGVYRDHFTGPLLFAHYSQKHTLKIPVELQQQIISQQIALQLKQQAEVERKKKQLTEAGENGTDTAASSAAGDAAGATATQNDSSIVSAAVKSTSFALAAADA